MIPPMPRPLVLSLALLVAACAGRDDPREGLWEAGDLLVLDADAGAADADGEPLSLLLVAAGETDGDWGEPLEVLAPRAWRDAVAMAFGPDGVLYVVESTGAHRGADDPARGGVFRVTREGDVSLAWTHPALRQPVHLAFDAERRRAYVTDRTADPLGLGRPTGAVFVIDVGDGPWPTGRACGDETLVTPAAVRVEPDGTALLLDADANPDGHPGTPGLLLRLAITDDNADFTEVVRFADTTSPIAFAGPWIVDANHARDGARIGAGALLTWTADDLDVAVTHEAFPPRTFVDPTGGVALPDGRLALADANADPLRLGHDELGRGVYGSGRGCVVAIDPRAEAPRGAVLVASPRFVTPIAVAVAPALSE